MRPGLIVFLCAACFGGWAGAQSDRGVWAGFYINDVRMGGGPEPENPTHLVDVLKRRDFHNYLEVSPQQAGAIKEMLRTLPTPTAQIIKSSPDPELTIKYYEGLVDDEIRKVISERQYTRLKQLCYRIEIGILGFPNSIAYGYLADAAGVYDN